MSPPQSLASVLATIARERPAATELQPFAAAIVQKGRDLAAQRDLFSSLPEEPLRIGEVAYLHSPGPTPVAFGSPGLLTQGPAEPFILQLLARSEWSSQQTEIFLGRIDTRTIELSVLRGIGAHLYYASLRSSRGRVRKARVPSTVRAGWEIYVEQAFLDEGYHREDPLLRLCQLHRALIEQCRLVTAVGLHAQGMKLSEAIGVFQDQAYLGFEAAQREAVGVVVEPERMVPALGKRLLLELRRDYLTENPVHGLRDFHDAFLSAGGIPFRLARHMLLVQRAIDVSS